MWGRALCVVVLLSLCSMGHSAQWLSEERWGDGSAGACNIVTDTTDAPLDSVCMGLAGRYDLGATNPGFAAGQIILIHQTQGQGAGQWELNVIQDYIQGTILTRYPLAYDYDPNAHSPAQVLVVPQYSTVTVAAEATWYAKAWNGQTGGILAFLCQGTATLEGNISASFAGYRGGLGAPPNSYSSFGQYGEGAPGPAEYATSNAANGNGGGSGQFSVNVDAGGGGGHGTSGSIGGAAYSLPGGDGGGTAGNAELSLLTFGGGGGGACDRSNGASGSQGSSGAAGGGAVFILAQSLNLTGAIATHGQTGESLPFITEYSACGGGGGAGGAVLIKSRLAELGTEHITALGGLGGEGRNGLGIDPVASGGNGGNGRVAVYFGTSATGSTQPAAQLIHDSNLEEPTTTPTITSTPTTVPTATPGGPVGQWLPNERWGNGQDGAFTLVSDATAAPLDSSCAGTAATVNLTATNPDFASGQIILIHQSRGANAGNWELNVIESYTTGTITTRYPLQFDYLDGGTNQVQVVVLPQYSSVSIASDVTWEAKAWNGDTGGIVAFCCNGTTNLEGTIRATQSGYIGGQGAPAGEGGTPNGGYGQYGEGTAGAAVTASDTNPNGNGGGAGQYSANVDAGGGGGHGTVGGIGGSGYSAPGALGGLIAGTADLTTMIFGGGGGGGSARSGGGLWEDGCDGAAGGGLVVIYSHVLNVFGAVHNQGGAGQSLPCLGDYIAVGGGGGAGGSVLVTACQANLGWRTINAAGGLGGDGKAYGDGIVHTGDGGDGGDGRIAVYYGDYYSGLTAPNCSTYLNAALLDPTSTPTATATDTPTASPTPTSTDTPNATPTPTKTPNPLGISAGEWYSLP